MPSRPLDTGWDFSRVITLIESDTDSGPVGLLPRVKTTLSSSPNDSHGASEGIHLGSFTKLWEELGIPDDGSLPAISPLETESDDQTDSDSALFPPTQSVEHRDVDENKIRHTDSEGVDKEYRHGPCAGMNKKQRQKARKRAEQQRKADAILEHQNQYTEKDKEEFEDILDLSPKKQLVRGAPAVTAKSQRSQSRSNVGAKMRPGTPSQEPRPTAGISNVASSPLPPAMGVVESTVSPIFVLEPTTLEPVFTLVPQSPKGIPPQSHGNGYARPLVSTPTGLIPRTVQPMVVSKVTTKLPVSPQMLQAPMTPQVASSSPMSPLAASFTPQMVQLHTVYTRLNIRPRVDRHFQFFHQLLREFPEDAPSLLSPMQLSNEKTSAEGIHVFVDSSNIMIGFKDMLKYHGAQGYEMSFDSLVLLMERRRPVAKRVYAGSHRESAPVPHIAKLTKMSKAIGYESIVNEQVLVSREDSDKKKFFKAVKKIGWIKAAQLHSGSSSDEPETDVTPSTPSAPKWVEQGVDEILHLKMCQSIIDTEIPTTMVLATGDGAKAEHSDGFLAHVERALKKGWKVELVSWRQQTNGGYRNKQFRAKWGDRFKIFHLDGYIESLIDTP